MNSFNLFFYCNECECFESFLKNYYLYFESFYFYLEKVFFEMVFNGGKRFCFKFFLVVFCVLVG